ncbi:2OG-Fe(II) oxygenase superfamily protein [Durotheca rogersii]|uniref:2OG-Fe(II) oxygenase superfamily protein n=1 Tax=Durotheca rogersii TaxID=419775 RepID=UPI00221F7B08|nr:2OG-Fe(II) oxygenase superfamily protein [Durotheca rogersii]KAI5865518.1 2OG-Fe(II) oxygenase superfamily protein [Durotheca rogersii]
MASAATIPIIDISADGADRAQVAKELVDAAVEYGFVYIRNASRDITPEQIDDVFNVSKILFASPLEDKQRCQIKKNNQGWAGVHTETLDPKTQRVGDFKEGFNFGTFDDEGKATQPIPPSIEPHQAQLAAFRRACHDLCRKLLLLFGVGLGVDPPDFFTAAHDPGLPSGSILRLLYYPAPDGSDAAAPVSRQDGDVRAGAHSDYGSVTLLFRLRGQAGLEILEPGTGAWAPVPVTPPGTENDPAPPILVNIGDLLSYWTQGLLRSTVHRVAFSGGPSSSSSVVPGESSDAPRYSVAYFCHPAEDTPLAPVPSRRVAERRPESAATAAAAVMTAREHLAARLRATYLQMYAHGAAGESA